MSHSDLAKLRRIRALREENANTVLRNARDAQTDAQTAWENAQTAFADHKSRLSGDGSMIPKKANLQDQVLKYARQAHRVANLKHTVKQTEIQRQEAAKTTTAARTSHNVASGRLEATCLLFDGLRKEAGARTDRQEEEETEEFSKPSIFPF
jgi:hypothetical protein